MSEEELQKMPKLWTQKELQVQVAAANEAGQSRWTTLKIPLTGVSAGVAVGDTAPARLTTPTPGGFVNAATMRTKRDAQK